MRRGKGVKILAGLVLGLFLLTGCGAGTGGENGRSQGSDGSPSEYLVGVTLELSGPASVWGIPQRDSLKLLEKRINEQGGIGGVPLRLIIYDNESDGTKALTTAKKLVEEDNVLAIIGGGSTPTTMPLIPYVTEAQVPLVSVGPATRLSNQLRSGAGCSRRRTTTGTRRQPFWISSRAGVPGGLHCSP